MAAMIEFVCTAAHKGRSDPAITVEQKAWAYCPAGASDQHQWTRIDPTSVETLRSPAGNGHTHLGPDQSDERTLAARPAR